jgi:hypothetical protein
LSSFPVDVCARAYGTWSVCMFFPALLRLPLFE